MTIATSNIRTLIPFAGGNYDELVSHPVFSALVQQVPTFWGLHEGEFFIFDFIENDVNVDLENNEARSTGTKTKRKDLRQGWDPTQRPLIVVYWRGKYYLWDGFNRWIELDDMGETSAPTWVYRLKEGYDFDEVKEHVQLSANNHSQSDEATMRDFINCGVRWAERNHIDDLDEIIDWINRSEHQFKSKEVNKIASRILVASEVTNIRHIRTGSQARKEAAEILEIDLEYKGSEITNPIVMCTKEDDYLTDAFLQHMRKIKDTPEDELESTEFLGYTKGAETEEELRKQREHAYEKMVLLDDLIDEYVEKRNKLLKKKVDPWIWLGFLPQLYGKECGDGIERKLVK